MDFCKKRRILYNIILFGAIFFALFFGTVNAYGEREESPWLWPVPDSFQIISLDSDLSGDMYFSGQSMKIGAGVSSADGHPDVVSATPGYVLYFVDKYDKKNDKGSGFGNYVIVQYGEINILYTNLSKVSCTYGRINPGDKIGTMGCTGNAEEISLSVFAYPKDSAYHDSTVHVFDKYISNPFYISKYEFGIGLEKSDLYGGHIGTYYKKTSGSFMTYSGGLNGNISKDNDFIAQVMTVNKNGTGLYSMPADDKSYISGTLKYGFVVDVCGSYDDAYGNKWLAIEKKGFRFWVKYSDVGFYDFDFSTVLTKEILPNSLYTKVVNVDYGGVLTSANNIVSYETVLYRNDVKVFSTVKDVNGNEIDIENLLTDNPIAAAMPDGNYRLVITVTERCPYPSADQIVKTQEVLACDFAVDSSVVYNDSPIIGKIMFDNVTVDGMTVNTTASDNEALKKIQVQAEIGSEKYTFDYKSEGGKITSFIDFGKFKSYGTKCTVTVTVYDNDGNSAKSERKVDLPQSGQGEVWQANEAIRIRDGAGLENIQISTLKSGESVTVTDIVVLPSYTWGKFSEGWFALDFAKYISGNLYSVSFDMNGGISPVPSPVSKRFNEAVSLPVITAMVEKCKFLGWSFSSDAVVPDFPVGAKFDVNESVTLFATWEDTEAPEISSVTVSSKEWTSDNVTVEINASDNCLIMLYSFDGGKTWQMSNRTVITKNREFKPGQIQVRDRVGTVTKYTQNVVIGNIDKDAPDISNAEVKIAAKDGECVIRISGITDSLSGIGSYTLYLSENDDMSDEVSFKVSDGSEFVLNNKYGVYYAVLEITDKVGNKSLYNIGKFISNEKSKAGAPLKIDEDSLVIDVYGEYVTVESFTDMFVSPVVVRSKAGRIMSAEELVGTGCTLMLKLTEEKSLLSMSSGSTSENVYVIHVIGDISGDGKISSRDLSILFDYVSELVSINNDYLIAADVNKDGTVNVRDLSRLYSHVNEKYPLY